MTPGQHSPNQPPLQELPAGVSMLKAFAPLDTTVNPDFLHYPNLESVAHAARQKETALQHAFYDSEPSSLREEKAARSLAMGYMVLAAEQLHHTRPDRQHLLSDRYTQHTTELYNKPQETVVNQLIAQQHAEFAAYRGSELVDQTMLESFLGKLPDPAEAETSAEALDFTDTAHTLKDILYARYGEALQVITDFTTGREGLVETEETAEVFRTAVGKLAEQDATWHTWQVVTTAGGGMMVSTKDKQIKIGARDNYTADRLLPLFGHEVLVHANRALNGSKTGDKLLETGLPGNLDLEEGIGVLTEYALSGVIPDKIQDRYIDVSLALGQRGHNPLTRKQLHELHFQRQYLRAQAAGKQPDTEKLRTGAWNHIDRIYRGSLGTDVIGVNSKDIAYYQGFLKAATYFKDTFQAGVPTEIYDYVMRGCFDPTDKRHEAYVLAV